MATGSGRGEMLVERRSQWRSALVLSLSKDMPRGAIEPPLLGVLRHPHLDAGEALAVDAEEPRGLLGEIDRPAVAGSAVVDPDIDRAAVPRVGHPQPGLERQPGMGGGHLATVESLAARRAPPLQLAAVPRGDAGRAARHALRGAAALK